MNNRARLSSILDGPSIELPKNAFAFPAGTSEDAILMQSPKTPEPAAESTPTPPARSVITEPDFSGTPQPIGALAGQGDFPQCALGVFIDIQGFAGVVVEIVGQSIKVRPPEGITQRFNANRLRTLYAPTIRPEPAAMPRIADLPARVTAPKPAQAEPEAPARVYIVDPDFSSPVRVINDYASQSEFPRCAYGKHVDILGYTGVVVEILKGSLKIQSPTGITRSYNAEVLRKVYGKA